MRYFHVISIVFLFSFTIMMSSNFVFAEEYKNISVVEIDGFEFTLTSDKFHYEQNEPVKIHWQVQNISDGNLEYIRSNSCSDGFRLDIYDSKGARLGKLSSMLSAIDPNDKVFHKIGLEFYGSLLSKIKEDPTQEIAILIVTSDKEAVKEELESLGASKISVGQRLSFVTALLRVTEIPKLAENSFVRGISDGGARVCAMAEYAEYLKPNESISGSYEWSALVGSSEKTVFPEPATPAYYTVAVRFNQLTHCLVIGIGDGYSELIIPEIQCPYYDWFQSMEDPEIFEKIYGVTEQEMIDSYVTNQSIHKAKLHEESKSNDSINYPRTEIREVIKSHWIDGKLVFEKIPITVTIDKIENLNFKTEKTKNGGWIKTAPDVYPKISPELQQMIDSKRNVMTSGLINPEDLVSVNIHTIHDKIDLTTLFNLKGDERKQEAERIKFQILDERKDLLDFFNTNHISVSSINPIYGQISVFTTLNFVNEISQRPDVKTVTWNLPATLHAEESRKITGIEIDYVTSTTISPLNINISNHVLNSNFVFSISPQDNATFIKFDIPNNFLYHNNTLNNSEFSDLMISVNNIPLSTNQYLLYNNSNLDVTTFQIDLLSVSLNPQYISQIILDDDIDSNLKNKYLKILPTLKQQLHQGVSLENIQCKENHILLLKPITDSPVCVTETTAKKLEWKIIQKNIHEETPTLQANESEILLKISDERIITSSSIHHPDPISAIGDCPTNWPTYTIDTPSQVAIGEEFDVIIDYSYAVPDNDAGYEDPDEIFEPEKYYGCLRSEISIEAPPFVKILDDRSVQKGHLERWNTSPPTLISESIIPYTFDNTGPQQEVITLRIDTPRFGDQLDEIYITPGNTIGATLTIAIHDNMVDLYYTDTELPRWTVDDYQKHESILAEIRNTFDIPKPVTITNQTWIDQNKPDLGYNPHPPQGNPPNMDEYAQWFLQLPHSNEMRYKYILDLGLPSPYLDRLFTTYPELYYESSYIPEVTHMDEFVQFLLDTYPDDDYRQLLADDGFTQEYIDYLFEKYSELN